MKKTLIFFCFLALILPSLQQAPLKKQQDLNENPNEVIFREFVRQQNL